MVLRSTDWAKMEIDKLIEALRREGKNLGKDVESPIGHISQILLDAANALEEQIKLGDELHSVMHHALQCPETDCIDVEGLCDWWELTRN
jgi:hypothetical protein